MTAVYFSREKLNALVPPAGLEGAAELLNGLEYDRSSVCSAVVTALRPLLARLAPEPEAGWLPALYAWLDNGLFPDPAYQAPPEAPVLAALAELLDGVLACEDAPFDMLTDLAAHGPEDGSRVADELPAFHAALHASHFVTMLRIGRELLPFDAASHTIGVHNIATLTAQCAKEAGLPVDVPLVSAAALCHDIGKFGCRGADAKRIPYLHYYYTWQWLSGHGMEHIAHISANHSTWDLEFENLPVESLLLIYADFRVRGTREGGRETVRIYSLAEAYAIILSKLADVTPEKERRYRTVYTKLRDFESYLHIRGVATEPGPAPQRETRDPALLTQQEALDALRALTFDHAIRLMHTVSTDASFDQLLEQARGEKNTLRIRTYLELFQEYHTYMSGGNKRKLLAFLYELLLYPEGDVRRLAGQLMGSVLANSGPKYRKELPSAAPQDAAAPAMLSVLEESLGLWEQTVAQCLHPDHKISPKHAQRISNSLKAVAETLLAETEDAARLAQPLLSRLPDATDEDSFVLLDALYHTPPHAVSTLAPAADRLRALLCGPDQSRRIAALRCLRRFRAAAPEDLLQEAAVPLADDLPAVRALRGRLSGKTPEPLSESEASLLYLSNLKTAVPWVVKNAQIDLLQADALQHTGNTFHTATHLSNLLSVSEHLPVREHAGRALLTISTRLSVDQRNEIIVDLMRELENGQEQIARFIPRYLGRLLSTMPEKEIRESIDFLDGLLRSGSARAASTSLRTLGSLISALPENSVLTEHCLGLLLTGVSHYDESVHRSAMTVLCHDVIGSERLPFSLRAHCFARVSKKLLCLLAEPAPGKLTFFNRAAMLNHLYRFLVQAEVVQGGLRFPAPLPAAFFPGTFDPFSAGHKRIVQEIRALGYEVYLAVDEFSWSKRTLARLLRRRIVNMSVADQWDTYVFPNAIPINIAMPEDIAQLRACFPGRSVTLVAGCDVVCGASAYRSLRPGGVQELDHLLIRRGETDETDIRTRLQGRVTFLELPPQLEGISSTRIRESIDQDVDISMLVDPIVQSYIYEYDLYLRSPQHKNVLQAQELEFRIVTGTEDDLPPALFERLRSTPEPLAILLRSRRRHAAVGWCCGHTVRPASLFAELGSVEAASAVRRLTSGKLLKLDHVEADDAQTRRMLVNELLARSLASDHTFALAHCVGEWLEELGFSPVEDAEGLLCVDMRAPIVLIQDVLLCIKKPHHDEPQVRAAVESARPRLRRALCALYPGRLVLSFDAELLNQSLMYRVQKLGGVLGAPAGQLGRAMCVPYGKILSDEIVPNTVTKTLHVDKTFAPDGSSFSVPAYPGYDTVRNQVRTIKAFRRPVILVDDLLHNGYRLDKLSPVFAAEELEIRTVVVGILSARGRDLMEVQGRQVECEYFIPNLHYWVTESLLYPFLGGDSVGTPAPGRMLPSINLILPYYYPRHYVGTTDAAIRDLSRTALENTLSILHALEQAHQEQFSTALTLRRLGEALYRPRLPDRGRSLRYDLSLPASACLEDDLLRLDRIRMRGGMIHGA